jgi:hypothetical protein
LPRIDGDLRQPSMNTDDEMPLNSPAIADLSRAMRHEPGFAAVGLI